jgi:hypothetical protein
MHLNNMPVKAGTYKMRRIFIARFLRHGGNLEAFRASYATQTS